MNKNILFILVLSFSLFISCEKDNLLPGEIRRNCFSGISQKKVLLIGLDGCRSDALIPCGSPAFPLLMEHAYVNMHCDRGPYTESSPGWSTVLHGVYPAKHGVTSNDITHLDYGNFHDIFYYMKQFNPKFSLAEVSNWDDFLRLTTNEDYAMNVNNDGEVKQQALFLLSHYPPDVLLLHFDAIDETGHSNGFSPVNPFYLNAIRQTGDYILQIMQLIEMREQNYGEEWMVIIASDHGGSGTAHYGQESIDATRYVFQIFRLPNINRQNMETASNVDIMPTILNYMGIPINSSWSLDGHPLFGSQQRQ
jgi:predicted AlkP superfamily pyrophosphatase or phosphodiesterase